VISATELASHKGPFADARHQGRDFAEKEKLPQGTSELGESLVMGLCDFVLFRCHETKSLALKYHMCQTISS
jgi:hypothetical protein